MLASCFCISAIMAFIWPSGEPTLLLSSQSPGFMFWALAGNAAQASAQAPARRAKVFFIEKRSPVTWM
jgi:hypothetical protein